jgi:hypothetical protein
MSRQSFAGQRLVNNLLANASSFIGWPMPRQLFAGQCLVNHFLKIKRNIENKE